MRAYVWRVQLKFILCSQAAHSRKIQSRSEVEFVQVSPPLAEHDFHSPTKVGAYVKLKMRYLTFVERIDLATEVTITAQTQRMKGSALRAATDVLGGA